MMDVIDAIRELLEPEPTTVKKDDAGAEPLEWRENHLYVFPAGMDEHQVAEAGNPPSQRERFGARAVYIPRGAGEEPKRQRSRALSLELDAKAHLYAGRIAANVSSGPWEELRCVVDYDFVRTLQVRGVSLRISGSRFLTTS